MCCMTWSPDIQLTRGAPVMSQLAGCAGRRSHLCLRARLVRSATARAIHARAAQRVRVRVLASSGPRHTHTHTPTQERRHAHLLQLGPPRRPRLLEQWITTACCRQPSTFEQQTLSTAQCPTCRPIVTPCNRPATDLQREATRVNSNASALPLPSTA